MCQAICDFRIVKTPNPRWLHNQRSRWKRSINNKTGWVDIPRGDSQKSEGKKGIRGGEKLFKESRKNELDGFLKDGTFKPIHGADIKGEKRVFGSRFIEYLKKVGDVLKWKIREVAQNYAYEDANYILTEEPTVQRFYHSHLHSLTH